MAVISTLADIIVEVAPLSNADDDDPLWTDVSRLGRGLETRRGAQQDAGRIEAGTMRCVLDNRDRRFDPEYGGLNYLNLTGSTGAETPDNSEISITGDLDLRIAVRLTDYTTALNQTLIAKWITSAGNESYRFAVNTDGTLFLDVSADGTNNLLQNSSAPSLVDDTLYCLRATFDADNGAAGRVYSFYKKNTTVATCARDLNDNTGWTLISTHTVATAISIFNNTQPLTIGRLADGTRTSIGRVYAAQVRQGIDGEVVAFPKFVDSIEWPVGAGTSLDSNRNTWSQSALTNILQDTAGSLIKPMMPVRARVRRSGIIYPLFTGYADSWNLSWRGHADAVVDLSATDGFKVLANVQLPESAWEMDVRALEPKYWYRLGEDETSQDAINAMNEDEKGSYQPLGFPPPPAESLNAFDSNSSRQFTPEDAWQRAGGVRGQYVAIPVALNPPFSFVMNFVPNADLNKKMFDEKPDDDIISRVLVEAIILPPGFENYDSSTYGGAVAFFLGVTLKDNTTPGREGTLDTFFTLGDSTTNVFVNKQDVTIQGSNSLLTPSRHQVGFTIGDRYCNVYIDGELRETLDFNAGHDWSVASPSIGTVKIGTRDFVREDNQGFLYSYGIVAGYWAWAGWIDEPMIYYQELDQSTMEGFWPLLREPWRGDLSSERIVRILDYCDWPAAVREIAVGDTTLGVASHLGTRALEYISEIVNTEQGRFFITKDGKAKFLNRHATYQAPLSDVQATFGDGSGASLGAIVLTNAGDFASTPDHSSLDITAELDIRAAVTLPDYTAAASQVLVAKDGTNQRSYIFQISAAGQLQFITSPDGTTAAQVIGTASTGAGLTDNTLYGLRGTFDPDNGASQKVYTYYKKTLDTTQPLLPQIESNSGWTLISTHTVATATSIYSGSGEVRIGRSFLSGNTFGQLHAAIVKDSIGGTTVANPDFSVQPSTTTYFADSTGKYWLLAGDSYIASVDGELPYVDLVIEYNDVDIVNEAKITREDGEPQTAKDTASQATYLKREVEIDTLADRDSDAKAFAEWIIYKHKQPKTRVREIRIRAQNDPTNLLPQVLQREIGERVKVRRRPPPDNVMQEYDVVIEGIQQVITPGTWETTFWLSDTDIEDVLIADHPTQSTLGDWISPL
jgi:hypothetical protein